MHIRLYATKLTTLRLSDEHQRLLEEANEIVADGSEDDPPMADVIQECTTFTPVPLPI
ncbi:DUF7386 family protein [Saliphagus infecundisoli]|uniref:DUF7386 family protein n=1 Tax=Saliphagus infecundisoli TaxID=1849069 RepID=UPI003CCD7902